MHRDRCEYSFKRGNGPRTTQTNIMWAIGPDFNFNEAMVEFYSDFDRARECAYDWSVELDGRPVYIFRMMAGVPTKWMRMTA